MLLLACLLCNMCCCWCLGCDSACLPLLCFAGSPAVVVNTDTCTGDSGECLNPCLTSHRMLSQAAADLSPPNICLCTSSAGGPLFLKAADANPANDLQACAAACAVVMGCMLHACNPKTQQPRPLLSPAGWPGILGAQPLRYRHPWRIHTAPRERHA